MRGLERGPWACGVPRSGERRSHQEAVAGEGVLPRTAPSEAALEKLVTVV